ncbi:hypothetical protein ABET15_14015 [Heyndrickxia faecalis]|uniref:hypothetical protein n=1 Tax=Heyndrickxia TaxID=2837504 RepID=UPI00054F0971|nr:MULTISPECIES: hypothetical protein [Heyndrickxia]APB37031.1 hypothetical protein BIZ35_09510 [Heyndrickxia coagulans]KGT38532.1 hypothetical protein P421_09220 [Heyndrickxia coagulans P38]MED4867347.1 hypothetical protein [Weizmannia sp. CD-2023]QPG52829.1 hypothetical protein IR208_12530 [Heyndrickxia coagulans]WNE60847.1 hypothetical protein KIY57_12975 [Heyndrickxia coagulans]
MIEVITYADVTLRLPERRDYETFIMNVFKQIEPHIKAEQIISISKPVVNSSNMALESTVMARLMLYIPEETPGLKVDEYIHQIVPFLKHYIPNCDKVGNTKIVQIKRMIE